MAKSRLFLFALIFLACQGAFGQTEGASQPAPMLFSLTLTPSVTVPLGRDAPYYNLGFGADISADFRMPFFPPWFVSGNVGYSLAPLEAVTSLSLLSGGVGTGLRFDSGKLCVKVRGAGGYFYGSLNDGTSRGGANPLVSVRKRITFTRQDFPSMLLGHEDGSPSSTSVQSSDSGPRRTRTSPMGRHRGPGSRSRRYFPGGACYGYLAADHSPWLARDRNEKTIAHRENSKARCRSEGTFISHPWSVTEA